jgi:hypothetical protein
MSITDGSFVCALCGEWLTGCGLCGAAPMQDMREQQRREEAEARDAERELMWQERSIRQAAEDRARQTGLFSVRDAPSEVSSD